MHDKYIPFSMNELISDWYRNAKSKNYQGAKILTLLSSLYFHINRYPTYEDRVLFEFQRNDVDNFIANQEQLLNDFKELYQVTQNRLKQLRDSGKLNVTEDDCIYLERKVCRVEQINKEKKEQDYFNTEEDPIYLIQKIKDGSINDVDVDMDILNSWAESSSLTYGIVTLKKRINLEDIIYFNRKNDLNDLGITECPPLEPDEYIVVNKSKTGIIYFSKSKGEIEIDNSIKRKFVEYPSRDSKEKRFRDRMEGRIEKDNAYYMFPFHHFDRQISLIKILRNAYIYWRNMRNSNKRII